MSGNKYVLTTSQGNSYWIKVVQQQAEATCVLWYKPKSIFVRKWRVLDVCINEAFIFSTLYNRFGYDASVRLVL